LANQIRDEPIMNKKCCRPQLESPNPSRRDPMASHRKSHFTSPKKAATHL
ncbi:hypothetical protein CCACVL1_09755, partial [Corchorus capsularis]